MTRGSTPAVYGVPLGVRFPRAVVSGLLSRIRSEQPESLARVEVYVNTRRMQRAMKAEFDDGPARLLPKIRLITDLASEAALDDIPPPVPPLRRRLELMQLISALLDAQPDLAPRAALFDLADSLASLMDEMQGEGIVPKAIETLDVADESGHWQRRLDFVRLIDQFTRADASAPDTETRQRLAVQGLIRRWQEAPPEHPVIVAGSTGSRGTTAQLMQAVARLPQGALILPGFDFDLPAAVWDSLIDARTGEDHPQFRFLRLMKALDLDPGAVAEWTPDPAPSPARNRLISLSLRPAPVTDQWMIEGARLSGVTQATDAMTLIAAPSVRAEALAIALILRDCVEQGKTAALVTPNRVLARQVTSALDRWGIVPDDSAGRPLQLTAPGRFLRHVAALFGRKVTADSLLTLLKHPLTHTGSTERGQHLLNTRELELSLRRHGPPFPQPSDLRRWGATGEAKRLGWASWLARLLDGVDQVQVRPLAAHLAHLVTLAEGLAQGADGTGSGTLWDKEAGRQARHWVTALHRDADAGGDLHPGEFASLLNSVLGRGEVREAIGTHPGVMIWGTLEARVQGADTVVLGGLNEGVWPEAARPDPWLNRAMRLDAGLLLPERRIGLSAHDYQQAVAAPEVVLSRSVRDGEAQTVPSRWVNRLTNLLSGLSEEGYRALLDMQARGDRWIAMAEALEAPQEAIRPAGRPSPRPPVAARPKTLSITEVQTLIRDPYAIYARHVLRLRPLDPLVLSPDAPLRGTILHKILEIFMDGAPVTDLAASKAALLAITDRILAEEAPWPTAQRMWRARLERVADWFLAGEVERQSRGRVLALERRAKLAFPDLGLVLTGKIDRVDEAPDGRLTVIDYKTGSPPSKDQQTHFDKQLSLAAALAEQGAIDGLPPANVAETVYIGLGASPRLEAGSCDPGATAETLSEFKTLIGSYRDRNQGYTARRAMEQTVFGGDYDHLARFGEWDDGATPEPQDVGP